MAKVVHVHLIGKRKDYYFSSISAVFTVLSREDIGVSKHWLLNAARGLEEVTWYTTKRL